MLCSNQIFFSNMRKLSYKVEYILAEQRRNEYFDTPCIPIVLPRLWTSRGSKEILYSLDSLDSCSVGSTMRVQKVPKYGNTLFPSRTRSYFISKMTGCKPLVTAQYGLGPLSGGFRSMNFHSFYSSDGTVIFVHTLENIASQNADMCCKNRHCLRCN